MRGYSKYQYWFIPFAYKLTRLSLPLLNNMPLTGVADVKKPAINTKRPST